MKIKARQKLVPAIAMLLVSAVVLGSASYAWFTMTKEVSATNMQVTAKAPTNLLISNGDENYDVTASATGTTAVLKPASSKSGSTFFKAEDSVGDIGAVQDATKIIAVTDAEKVGYYKDFTFKFKNSGDKAVNVNIDPTKIAVTNSNGTAAMAKAVRFAILDSAGAESAAKPKNLFAGAGYEYFADQGPITTAGAIGAKLANEDINNTNSLFTVAGNNVVTTITIRVWFEGQDINCVNKNANTDCKLAVAFTGTEVA